MKGRRFQPWKWPPGMVLRDGKLVRREYAAKGRGFQASYARLLPKAPVKPDGDKPK